jgi:D-serine dehydratase
MNDNNDLLQNFPFLTIVRCGQREYVGIIQNEDINITSLYSIEHIKTEEEKKYFIKLATEWWWETNRQLPINIVIGKRFDMFEYCLITFSNKNLEFVSGPTVRIRDLLKTRSKKKNVQLIKKVK